LKSRAATSAKTIQLRIWVATIILAGLLTFAAQWFRNSAWITGYIFLALIVGLMAFRARKRLSVIPLASAATWTRLHIALGALGFALYWLHTGSIWPTGPYEQMLAVLFYLVSVSGIIGYILDRGYPGRLTQTGIEVIYERIPAELAILREQAEALIEECTRETASQTLARHYVETLYWFFRKPRFVFNHIWGGRKGFHWIRSRCDYVNRYLNDAERVYLDRLKQLAETKDKLDFHFAVQGMLKHWLFVHVPLAGALFVAVLWHLLLVNIYAQWSR
jgi:hypothetical protein